MKYIVTSTDGYGPKLYTDYDEARRQAMYYLYLADEYAHVEILEVGDDSVSKQSYYYDDHYEEANKVYGEWKS